MARRSLATKHVLPCKGIPDVPGSIYEMFSRIAAKNVTVDMIVQNVADGGRTDISFTVPRDELKITLDAVNEGRTILGNVGISYDEEVAKVSVVGSGMATQFGVSDRMFAALANAGINIQMISTSEIKISALVAREHALPALRAVHRAFELEKEEVAAHPESERRAAAPSRSVHFEPRDALEVVKSLQGMEELTIDHIAHDDSQGRVTIFGVPDVPGVAQQVFRRIGEAGILVDMIVQSYPNEGSANLSFTVPRQDLTRSIAVAEELTATFPSLRVTSSPDVAKLSVSGIGLRSHTSVAIRMFRALAEAGINVAMINTSEVRVNVVIDGAAGATGLACLKAAFADVT